ncbi:unnamed protein product [Symbiodinium natans]|uniref:WW domain-containing protein n=1 Tax=Symbiodinium natans TaxID=878477 RepID=A0A812SMU9_9DINO|nr:unnamed protein product [Symbiodinium natans]
MALHGSAPLRQTSLGEFLRSFRGRAVERGIKGPCEIINVLARAAWDLPLPLPWREETSSNGSIYFWNEVAGTAMWQHPLMEVFLSALESMVELVRESTSITDVVVALAAHLKLGLCVLNCEIGQERLQKPSSAWEQPRLDSPLPLLLRCIPARIPI